MRKWVVKSKQQDTRDKYQAEDIISILLENRGITTKKDIELFLHPKNPLELTCKDVGIDAKQLQKGIQRIKTALKNNESIVVHADYDADGITAGAIMWETLYSLGARVMPYVPKREDEGRGMPKESIDNVRELYDPSLIITVDHGITAHSGVSYAKSKHIDMIVSDHHVAPKKLPDCPIVHTTTLSGSGVSWFFAKEIVRAVRSNKPSQMSSIKEQLSLAALGTIADLVPLIGVNRAIAKYGLEEMRKTKRVGLLAMIESASIVKDEISTYSVSHILAPRINAMGRLEHALDALRLLCTNNQKKAQKLAESLGLTNKRRQDMTMESIAHALKSVQHTDGIPETKILFVASEEYNQGIVGLVAGRLVEKFYRPAIVVSIGDDLSKASARSIKGFNIVQALREHKDLLVDVGGHPLAAGFTIETKKIEKLQQKIQLFADSNIQDDNLVPVLKTDMELSLHDVTVSLWKELCRFEPFGFGNYEPVFVAKNVGLVSSRLVGKDKRHIKLVVEETREKNRHAKVVFDAIAFGLGSIHDEIKKYENIDIAYTIDMNEWNGRRSLQLKIRDIKVSNS